MNSRCRFRRINCSLDAKVGKGTALDSDGQPASPVPGSQWLMMHNGQETCHDAACYFSPKPLFAMYEPLHMLEVHVDVALLDSTGVAFDFFMSQPTMRVAIMMYCMFKLSKMIQVGRSNLAG